MFWMDSGLPMPFTTALTTARAGACVCPTNAFVSVTGVARIAVWNYVRMHAQIMDTVKETDVSVKKGKSIVLLFCFYLVIKQLNCLLWVVINVLPIKLCD